MEDAPSTRPDRLTLALRWVLGLIGLAAIIAGGSIAYAYASTPGAVRVPQQAHYHFRIQVINNGQAVNFAEGKYQTEFRKDMCTAAITNEPSHFHDGLDQFVHVHWAHLTGGMILKNYGWNFIGGAPSTLGYRFDDFPRITRVPIHGRSLPRQTSGAKYYIYTSSISSPTNYIERSWNDFLQQDLEQFMANPGVQKTSLLDRLIPSASAHTEEEAQAEGTAHAPGEVVPSSSPSPAPVSSAAEAELAELNHVLGNVVIFVQADPPTADQIKDRLTKLTPLPESSCAG